jgi:hypothetical protein
MTNFNQSVYLANPVSKVNSNTLVINFRYTNEKEKKTIKPSIDLPPSYNGHSLDIITKLHTMVTTSTYTKCIIQS